MCDIVLFLIEKENFHGCNDECGSFCFYVVLPGSKDDDRQCYAWKNGV